MNTTTRKPRDWGVLAQPLSYNGLAWRIILRQMWRSKARFLSILGSTLFSCMAAMAALSITGSSEKFQLALIISAASCLIVGVVSISQSLQVAAVESRDDSQALLASGFPSSMVMGMVIIESALAAIIGAIIGCITGSILARIGVPLLVAQEIQGFTALEAVFRPWAFLLVLIGGVLTAVIAGIRPAISAMRMDWSREGEIDFQNDTNAAKVTWFVGLLAFLAGIILMVWSNISPVEADWQTVILECTLFVIGLYVSYPLLFKTMVHGLRFLVEKLGHCKRPSVLIALRSVELRNHSASAVSAAVTVGLLFLAVVTMIGSWDSTKAQLDMAEVYHGTSQIRLRKSTGLEDFRQSDINAWRHMDGVSDVLTFSAHEAKMQSPAGKTVKIAYYSIDGNPFTHLISGDEEAAQVWATGKGAIIGCQLVERTGLRVGDTYSIGSKGSYSDVKVIGETCNPWLNDDLLIPAQLMKDHDITSVYIVHQAPVDSTAFNEKMSDEYPEYVFFNRENVIKRRGTGALWELLVYYGAGAMVITVAVTGLFTMMALSVMQRKREFGLLSAYGMNTGQLHVSIWLEAGVISLVAGILGAGLGSVLGLVIGSKMGMSVIDASTWILESWLVIATVIVGVFAAVIPSFVVVRAGASSIRDE